MPDSAGILTRVREAAKVKVLFLPHAVSQMSRPDRMITPDEVRRVLSDGELVEDYPEDRRGHSCLLSGRGEDGRAVHVVCAPKDEFLAVITAYLPSPEAWQDNFTARRQR